MRALALSLGARLMRGRRFGHAAVVMSLAACLCAASAFGAGGAYPTSAEEAIAGAAIAPSSTVTVSPNRTLTRRAESAI